MLHALPANTAVHQRMYVCALSRAPGRRHRGATHALTLPPPLPPSVHGPPHKLPCCPFTPAQHPRRPADSTATMQTACLSQQLQGARSVGGWLEGAFMGWDRADGAIAPRCSANARLLLGGCCREHEGPDRPPAQDGGLRAPRAHQGRQRQRPAARVPPGDAAAWPLPPRRVAGLPILLRLWECCVQGLQPVELLLSISVCCSGVGRVHCYRLVARHRRRHRHRSGRSGLQGRGQLLWQQGEGCVGGRAGMLAACGVNRQRGSTGRSLRCRRSTRPRRCSRLCLPALQPRRWHSRLRAWAARPSPWAPTWARWGLRAAAAAAAGLLLRRVERRRGHVAASGRRCCRRLMRLPACLPARTHACSARTLSGCSRRCRRSGAAWMCW